MKSFKKSVIPIHALGFAICCACSASLQAQQTIANPLVRPALSQGGSAPAQGSDPNERAVAVPSAQSDEELRRQAERRVTQEDLNIRQQA